MPLSQTQLAEYRKRGWLVVEGVITAAQADWAARRALELAEQALAAEGARAVTQERDAAGRVLAPRKVSHPFSKDPAFGRMLFESELPALLGQLMGVRPRFFTDQV